MIVLIAGKAEHGKTTVASILKKEFESEGKRVILTNFASYLKFIAKQYYGWNGKKDSYGRELLQYLGTDVARRIDPDFWVDAMWNFIRVFCQDEDYVIIDDVRFKNEVKFFGVRGIPCMSIRVVRNNFENSLSEEQRNHLSE